MPNADATQSGTIDRLEVIGYLRAEKAKLQFWIPCWETNNFGAEKKRADEARKRIREIDNLLIDYNSGVRKWVRA